MTENTTELTRPLVVGHKRDGRCRYDVEAKRELVEACLRPGVSVARVALRHGINANLLRTWITCHQRRHPVLGTPPEAAKSAFISVETKGYSKAGGLKLEARLSNGVHLELSDASPLDLASVLRLLNDLPCSGSTRG